MLWVGCEEDAIVNIDFRKFWKWEEEISDAWYLLFWLFLFIYLYKFKRDLYLYKLKNRNSIKDISPYYISVILIKSQTHSKFKFLSMQRFFSHYWNSLKFFLMRLRIDTVVQKLLWSVLRQIVRIVQSYPGTHWLQNSSNPMLTAFWWKKKMFQQLVLAWDLLHLPQIAWVMKPPHKRQCFITHRLLGTGGFQHSSIACYNFQDNLTTTTEVPLYL